MDIRELRIGDIVTTNGKPMGTKKDEYYRVIEIDSKNNLNDMKTNKLTIEEMAAFKKWLGEEGIRYFRHLKGLKGTVVPVLGSKKGMPWPVHLREGMQIRNWLRGNTELGKKLDSVELDDCYVSILEEAIK